MAVVVRPARVAVGAGGEHARQLHQARGAAAAAAAAANTRPFAASAAFFATAAADAGADMVAAADAEEVEAEEDAARPATALPRVLSTRGRPQPPGRLAMTTPRASMPAQVASW